MAVSRVKTSSVLQGFPKYRSMLAGNAYYQPTAYESIATFSTNNVATATFSSIPSTYSSLQLRIRYKAADGEPLRIRFNGDTGSNYITHFLEGNGASASAGATSTTTSGILTPENSESPNSTQPTVIVLDLHDYASTTKNKTSRIIRGIDINGSNGSIISLISCLYMSTSAINSITIYNAYGTSWTEAPSFALYGIKGA